jgi:hypothetical protein
MKKPQSVNSLEELGRTRLSKSFFMRDFLYSEISNFYGTPNIPDDPDLAIQACSNLCAELLEPLNDTFGRLSIFSGYRSPSVNQIGNEKNLRCASNDASYAGHIFDHRDMEGCIGATVSIVIPWFADRYEQGRIGARWPGGYMIICLITHYASSLAMVYRVSRYSDVFKVAKFKLIDKYILGHGWL